MDTPSPDHDPDDTLIRKRAALSAEQLAGATTPPAPPPADSRRVRRPVLIAALATVCGLLGGVYLVGYLMAGDKLPRDARISDVEVGGLTRTVAVERLTAELGPRVGTPAEVAAGGKRGKFDPVAAGVAVDYEATIAAAGGGRSASPAHILRVLTGGGDSDAVLSVDQAKLTAAVAATAGALDQSAKDAAVAYDGVKVVRAKARPGITVNQPEAAAAIQAQLAGAERPLVLPAAVVEPAVTDDEASAVADGFAKLAVAAPVKVKAGSAGTFTLTPAMVAGALSFPSVDGAIRPVLDAAKLRANAASAVAKVELKEPRDATVRLVGGKPKVIPAVNGTKLAANDLKTAVEPVLTKPKRERSVSVELTGAKAKFSTEDAKKLGIKRVIGKFTTYYPYLPYRNINIGRAAEKINGTVLKPGEVFSLNGIVGERTRANGFTEGFIIKGGKFKKELGGGVSQSATTTFNAMFFAGLRDIQHQPHTLFIDRYPPGREATVAWPGLDLKFQNNTKYGVLVQAFRVPGTPSRRGSITVRMWSTKTWDKVVSTTPVKSNFTTGQDLKDKSSDCEPMTPVQGFDVNYQRLFYRGNTVAKRENFHWRYAPTNKVTCVRD